MEKKLVKDVVSKLEAIREEINGMDVILTDKNPDELSFKEWHELPIVKIRNKYNQHIKCAVIKIKNGAVYGRNLTLYREELMTSLHNLNTDEIIALADYLTTK